MLDKLSRLLMPLMLLGIISHGTMAMGPAHFQGSPAQDSLTTTEHLIQFAAKQLHIPYRAGGSSLKGFDCSGFVRYCYQQFDILLPHSSAKQASHGDAVRLEDAKPGDLVFFKGQSTKSSIGHVGIITDIGPNSVRFIHAAFKGGIRYDLLQADYYRKRLVAIRRLVR